MQRRLFFVYRDLAPEIIESGLITDIHITENRNVASSRPVYYSIFEHFGSATNQQDVLLLPCTAIKQITQNYA